MLFERRSSILVRFMINLFALGVFAAVAVLAADTPTVVTVRPEPGMPRDILTNEGLVILSDAGFSDSFIALKISCSRTRFDASAEGLAYLRHSSLSEELVTFVMQLAVRPPMVAPAQPGPTMVPMKVVKRRVLVPIEAESRANPSFVAIPAQASAPDAWNNRSWSYADYYRYAGATGYSWPGNLQVVYSTPGQPILQSPTYSTPMPVLYTAGPAYTWGYRR
jgi:hypothetical protein